jgi:class 3 adenylate cyclase
VDQVDGTTLLFTDIQGSTRLLAGLGEALYAGVLAQHHHLIREAIEAHGEEVERLSATGRAANPLDFH